MSVCVGSFSNIQVIETSKKSFIFKKSQKQDVSVFIQTSSSVVMLQQDESLTSKYTQSKKSKDLCIWEQFFSDNTHYGLHLSKSCVFMPCACHVTSLSVIIGQRYFLVQHYS